MREEDIVGCGLGAAKRHIFTENKRCLRIREKEDIHSQKTGKSHRVWGERGDRLPQR